MVTTAQIESVLDKGEFTLKQTRAIAEAIEPAQRKTQEGVETDLRGWMKNRFVTKEEFHKEMAGLRVGISGGKTEVIKWMFIFWIGQIGALFAFLKLLK